MLDGRVLEAIWKTPLQREHPRPLSPHQRALGGVQGLPGPDALEASQREAEEQVKIREQLCVHTSLHPENLRKLLFGATSKCEQASAFSRNLALKLPFGSKAKEALRDLADDFNVRDPRKLYRLARQRDLDVTQAMAFEALKADVGRQVQAPRPRALGKSAAEGPNDRLQADLVNFSQNTRGKTKCGLVMDVFTREAAVEPLQNKNAKTVGRATKRAARELTGDDGNFVVTTDLGNEFARWTGSCPKMPCTAQSGPRTATPSPWWTGARR